VLGEAKSPAAVVRRSRGDLCRWGRRHVRFLIRTQEMMRAARIYPGGDPGLRAFTRTGPRLAGPHPHLLWGPLPKGEGTVLLPGPGRPGTGVLIGALSPAQGSDWRSSSEDFLVRRRRGFLSVGASDWADGSSPSA